MNSTELKKQLIKLSQAPLEKLGSSELKKISAQIQGVNDSLERMTIIQKVEELFHSIALEHKPFYAELLKKFSSKKPGSTGKKEAWEKYHFQLKNFLEHCKHKKNDLSKLLSNLQKMKEEAALSQIKKLKAEEKKLLSLLASLTERKSRGVGTLSLGNNQAMNLIWLRELKNVKQLGVLYNEGL